MTCQNDKEPRLEKQLSRLKLISSSREALSNVFLYLFLSPVQVAPNFVATINHFSPTLKHEFISSLITFVSLLCGIFVYKLLLEVLFF